MEVKTVATRGRKPKATNLKVLEGNPGKRPLNKNEPKPKEKLPPCPKWLEPEAKKEWRRMGKKLLELGVISEIDGAAFAGYCQAYARWIEAEQFMSVHGTIFKTPKGYIQQVPQVSIARQYLKAMKEFCSEFGLTPSSRTRIVTNDTKEEAEDPMEAMLIRRTKRV